MGKCLSCCDQINQPTQNGSTPAKGPTRPPPPPITAPYRSEIPKHISVSSISEKPIPMIANKDKKPGFSQYPKLPPIRKSSTESKKAQVTQHSDFSVSRINSLFEIYKDNNSDAILAEGIEKFCDDLNVKPDEFIVLVLAWKFDAEIMCRFTRSEFVNGCKKLKTDSIKGIQSKFPEMLQEIKDKQIFKDFYKWTYKFSLESDVGQRTLPVDVAISMWPLVYYQNEPKILKPWLEFLRRHPSIRGISKDTWDMFLNFTEHIGSDLSKYDDTEAWPSLFDDFVEYENDRKNQNISDKSSSE